MSSFSHTILTLALLSDLHIRADCSLAGGFQDWKSFGIPEGWERGLSTKEEPGGPASLGAVGLL